MIPSGPVHVPEAGLDLPALVCTGSAEREFNEALRAFLRTHAPA